MSTADFASIVVLVLLSTSLVLFFSYSFWFHRRLRRDSARLTETRKKSEALAADWERKFWEQHGVIERILRQRDEWVGLYRKHSVQHVSAQNTLTKAVQRLREQLLRALFMLNAMRREKDLPEIKKPSDLEPLDGPPCDIAGEFVEQMKADEDQMSELIDGATERDKIAEDLPS